jgi:ADP-dependent NAD(P)H-hydrate dehydratase / NAD(P)H-hydrate epimerase
MILTTQQMRALEARCFAAGVITSAQAMERAGAAVAAEVLKRWPEAGAALVLCGPGNNGGDGFVVARRLAAAGWDVEAFTWDDPARLVGDAAAMRDLWFASGGRARTRFLTESGVLGSDQPVVVDALFGVGLSRAMPTWLGDADACAWASSRKIVAVDIPSGLAADSGQVLGAALRADVTVTFQALKPAHVLLPGSELCGEVVTADIGLEAPVPELLKGHPERASEPALSLNEQPRIWPRRADQHKYSHGLALVVSGGLASTGAARLAARAALRVGAGLVRVLSPPSALAVNAHHLTSIMLERFDAPGDLAAQLAHPKASALLIGPAAGVGEATRANVLACLDALRQRSRPAALVLDADALTSFQDAPETLFAAIQAVPTTAGTVALTPHSGEYARLFPDLAQVPSKIDRALQAARRSGAIVLLKGADTVIAAPQARAVVNTHASPWLATAGSGDVLAGLIAGLLCNHRIYDPFQAVCAAAWMHGELGRRLGPGLIAEDLPEAIPALLRDILAA